MGGQATTNTHETKEPEKEEAQSGQDAASAGQGEYRGCTRRVDGSIIKLSSLPEAGIQDLRLVHGRRSDEPRQTILREEIDEAACEVPTTRGREVVGFDLQGSKGVVDAVSPAGGSAGQVV